MIKLYWSPRTRSFSSLWLMEETGQPYQRVLVDISKGAQKAPKYLAINRATSIAARRGRRSSGRARSRRAESEVWTPPHKRRTDSYSAAVFSSSGRGIE